MNSSIQIVLAVVQLLTVLALSFTALSQEKKRKSQLPLILTPVLAILAAVLISSVAALSMEESDYVEYSKLWFFQMLGIALGMLFRDAILGRRVLSSRIVLNTRFMRQLCLFIFVPGVLCALVFFAWKGIPIFAGNVEQARVDASGAGTGAFRLMTYLTIAPALLIFALSPRKGKYYVALSIILVFFLANRSALVYLFVPMVFVSISRKIKLKRIGSMKPILMGSLFMLIVVGIGAYRIFTQVEFQLFPEYSAAIANKDVAKVALLSFEHYANVVANNAVLTKTLIDNGTIDRKYGTSYFALFTTAISSDAMTLDHEIRLGSGQVFIGGNIPPTLMGEGYANFGYPGTVLECGFVVLLLEYWYRIVLSTYSGADRTLSSVAHAMYGYMVCWVVMSQVAGLAGAATSPLADALTLFLIWGLTVRREVEPLVRRVSAGA